MPVLLFLRDNSGTLNGKGKPPAFRGGLRLGLKVFGHSHFKMYLRHKSEEFKWE